MNKDLPHGMGSYIQYTVITHKEKESEKEYIYIYKNYFVIYPKLTQLYFNKKWRITLYLLFYENCFSRFRILHMSSQVSPGHFIWEGLCSLLGCA